jgi:hypothetical protein
MTTKREKRATRKVNCRKQANTQTPRWFQKPLWRRCQNPLILQSRNGGFCAFQKDLVLESRLTVFGSVSGLPSWKSIKLPILRAYPAVESRFLEFAYPRSYRRATVGSTFAARRAGR